MSTVLILLTIVLILVVAGMIRGQYRDGQMIFIIEIRKFRSIARKLFEAGRKINWRLRQPPGSSCR